MKLLDQRDKKLLRIHPPIYDFIQDYIVLLQTDGENDLCARLKSVILCPLSLRHSM